MRPIRRVFFLLCICVASFAGEEPADGTVATVVVTSASTYNDVIVDHCLDPECERTRRIGLLAGTRFLRAFEGTPNMDEDYGDRHNQTITVPADEPSTIRFRTIKDVITFGGEPRVERTYTDYYGLNITLMRTRVTYMESEERLICDALVQLEPQAGSTFQLMHDHDDETEECSVTEVADAAEAADAVAESVPEGEESEPFYEIPLGENCTARHEALRLSGYQRNTPVLFIQVSLPEGQESADVAMTKFTRLGDPLIDWAGQLGLESWTESVRLVESADFWNLPAEGRRSDRAREVWQVEACIGGAFHSVKSAPKADPSLRELINFLANTDY